MHDFSIGHRLILLRQRNPLLWASEADFNSLPFEQQIMWLISAATVCSLPINPGFWTKLKHSFDVRCNRWIRRKFNQADWALEIANFRNYLAASQIITRYEDRREGFPFMPTVSGTDSESRSLGGPYDATLIQFLVKIFRLTQSEAMQYPVGLAQSHFLVHLEREGGLKILNGEEMDFKDYSRQRDMEAAKAAGFKTVGEHVAHVLAEAQRAKEAAATKE